MFESKQPIKEPGFSAACVHTANGRAIARRVEIPDASGHGHHPSLVAGRWPTRTVLFDDDRSTGDDHEKTSAWHIRSSHRDGRSYPGSGNSGGGGRRILRGGAILGIHSSIDGGAYSRLTITDPRKHTILKVRPRGRLAHQGLTQLFFESAEPKFDELDPPTFFRRFPDGPYDIRARSLEGDVLKATVALSHVLAAPVANITVSGVPAAASCDAVPLPSVSEPILIDWDPVTESHPEIGKSGPVEIVRYQFFVEREAQRRPSAHGDAVRGSIGRHRPRQ
jgi:hypothetical protein